MFIWLPFSVPSPGRGYLFIPLCRTADRAAAVQWL